MGSMEQGGADVPSETLAQDSAEQLVGEQSEVIPLEVRSKDELQNSSCSTTKVSFPPGTFIYPAPPNGYLQNVPDVFLIAGGASFHRHIH